MIRLRESLFFKLLLVFVVAALADVAVLRFFDRELLSNSAQRQHRSQNMAEYGKLLVGQMTSPPDQAQVQSLSERLHMKIRVQGPSGTLVSSSDVPSISDVESKMTLRYSSETAKVGKLGDRLVVDILGNHGERWLFFLETEMAYDEHPDLVAGLIGTLLLILVASYFAIRLMLSPLREIERGVRQVADGDLQVHLESTSGNELGRLAQSFNTMTAQVRTMIAAKEQLLLDVSHEFRSPLTRMKVAMELTSPEARDSILRSLQDLETMLSELLESARMDNPSGQLRLQPVDLSSLLQELVSLYEDQSPGLTLNLVVPSVLVKGDPARLQIAFRNLVDNAVKYSQNQNRPVEVGLDLTDRRTVLVTVRDYGPGIPLEEQALIFEPFYRIDRSRMKTTGGYGLGLSLTRKIILAHQGQVQVSSSPGQGTQFTVELQL